MHFWLLQPPPTPHAHTHTHTHANIHEHHRDAQLPHVPPNLTLFQQLKSGIILGMSGLPAVLR
jgi:hypothetical protein